MTADSLFEDMDVGAFWFLQEITGTIIKIESKKH
jgi:hypothetical protein